MTTPPVAPLVEPLTVARLAVDLNIPEEKLSDAATAELEFHLRAAIRHVETKHAVLPRDRVVSFDLEHGRGLLPVWPVYAIVSAVDAALLPVSLSANDAGEVSSATHRSGRITATVTVGYPAGTMPEDLALGILITAAHMYAVGQRVPGQQAGQRPGFGNGAPAAASAGFAIPNRAATYLAPYMPPSAG